MDAMLQYLPIGDAHGCTKVVLVEQVMHMVHIRRKLLKVRLYFGLLYADSNS